MELRPRAPVDGRAHGLAVVEDPPFGGADQAEDEAPDRGLAAAALAEQAEDLAAPDLEVDAVHGAHQGLPTQDSIKKGSADGEKLP